jgi:acyl-CoA thioesterase-1
MKPILITLCFLLSFGTLAKTSNNILIIGDSLSAGYGIQIHESWPALLQNTLDAKKSGYRVHNASISGQTSSEGASQMDQLLKLTQPKLVIIELGANDGLRGLSVSQMQSNLQTMISKSQMAKSQVLLLGIKVPLNYGRRYSAMFDASFTNLASKNRIAIVPFMLEPLLNTVTSKNRAEYIQEDGLHPTAIAQPIILKHLLPKILLSLNLNSAL